MLEKRERMNNSVDNEDSARLDHVSELSKNARTSWFALIALSVFIGVTLLNHVDADFFAYNAETKLPIVNVDIPVRSFFVFAPLLVAALYIYLHLYLMTLWDALADLEQSKGEQALADRIYPWLISHAALWYRNYVRKDGSAAPRALGWMVVAISLLLGCAFGPLILFLLWYRSLPAHEEWLTLWIAACLLATITVGYTGVRVASERMRNVPRDKVASRRKAPRVFAGVLTAVLATISWETTEGGLLGRSVHLQDGSTEWRPIIALFPANLRESVLIEKPEDWQSFDRWINTFDKAFRVDHGLASKEDLTQSQLRSYWETAKIEWASQLESIDRLNLRQRDLRNADMFRAVLPGADLRGARLNGANLNHAELQGADFSCFVPSRGDEICTQLGLADLTQAKLQGADFSRSDMRNVNLTVAQMQGANLNAAQINGAMMIHAKMQGTDLNSSHLQGAVLYIAQLQASDLGWAQMQGSVLFGADLRGTSLYATDFLGSDLRGTKILGEGCITTSYIGTLLHSATLSCVLDQEDLKFAVGNDKTVLPEGLTVPTCLEALPENVEAALSLMPETIDPTLGFSKSEVLDYFLCDRDTDGTILERPRRVGNNSVVKD